MPELPEVETIRRDLLRKIDDRKIKKVHLTGKARINKSPGYFKKFLTGKFIDDIDRLGKLLIVSFKNSRVYLLIHLKMTGQLIYQKGDKIVAGGHPVPTLDKVFDLPGKFTRVWFEFGDGARLYFNDLRRFGYLKLANVNELTKIKQGFGIEPNRKDFTYKNFSKRLAGRKTTVKALLLNQKIFAGIGNIYADESCFSAGLMPARRVDGLSEIEAKRLYNSIQKVIKRAVAERGTTFHDYVDGEGKNGYYMKYLKVYGREGKKCKRCGGIIKKTTLAGRGTCFCPKCQK